MENYVIHIKADRYEAGKWEFLHVEVIMKIIDYKFYFIHFTLTVKVNFGN